MNVFGPAAILCLGAGRYAHYLSLLRMRKGRTSQTGPSSRPGRRDVSSAIAIAAGGAVGRMFACHGRRHTCTQRPGVVLAAELPASRAAGQRCGPPVVVGCTGGKLSAGVSTTSFDTANTPSRSIAIGPVNALVHGKWSCEEPEAVKAASAVGRNVRAIAANVQGAAESDRLWGKVAEAQATQKLAREEKARRLKRKRRRAVD
jgi:hypothetical protein